MVIFVKSYEIFQIIARFVVGSNNLIYLCTLKNSEIMKRTLLSIVAVILMTGSLFARVDRYKTDVDRDKTINHITYELPLYFAKDRTNLVGVYTLATNIGGKSSGTLSFDFKETENKFSRELRDAMLRISKDIHDTPDPHIHIAMTLSSGEVLTFDGSYFHDWTKEEWNQLIHVSYNKETKEYRTYMMFPLEYLKSSNRHMSHNVSERYKYVLKALAKNDIVMLQVFDESNNANVKITIPIDRPTAETIADMQKKKVKPSKAKPNKNQSRAQSGRR